jgi:hypothetical protein
MRRPAAVILLLVWLVPVTGVATDWAATEIHLNILNFEVKSLARVTYECHVSMFESCGFNGYHQLNDGGVGQIGRTDFHYINQIDYSNELSASTIYSHCYRSTVAVTAPGVDQASHSTQQCAPPGPNPGPRPGGGVPIACDPGHSGCTEGFPEPLILDLNGDGIHTVALDQSPVSFDMDGNGRTDVTAWTDPATEEGFLFYDLNHNGIIDGGQELFGDATTLPNGKQAKTGVEVLGLCDTRRYGGNGDGVISAGDFAFGKIRVWVDRNHDAVATRDETYSLPELGVTELSLQFRELTAAESWGIDSAGNYHRFQGNFTQRLGTGRRATTVTRAMDDVYFRAIMSGN